MGRQAREPGTTCRASVQKSLLLRICKDALCAVVLGERGHAPPA
jgi:hypothetical protein